MKSTRKDKNVGKQKTKFSEKTSVSGENSNVQVAFIKYVELNVVAQQEGGGNRNQTVVKFFCC